jgi:hypothetical protein
VEPIPLGLVAASTLAWFLTSAKTHGREIRLERELQGIDEVDFRRSTPNHPWVEELWRRDRIGYWTRATAAFVLIGAMLVYLLGSWWWMLLAWILAMSLAFTGQAVASARRRKDATEAGPPPAPIGPSTRFHDQAWLGGARSGTRRWMLLTFLTMLATLIALANGIVGTLT